MHLRFTETGYHITYWLFVLVFLTVLFGRSWDDELAAFYFIAMLLPIVLGTSYFFNYFLIPYYFLKKQYFWFGLYSFYTLVVSLYLEMIVLMLSFIYLGNYSLHKLSPNASDTLLLAVTLYFLVFLGSFLLMINQIKAHKQRIHQLLQEQEKEADRYLEVLSNRKTTKIAYEDICYIESLTDYVHIHTPQETVVTKEKISHLEEILPHPFLRIHRSFIVNTSKVTSYSNQDVTLGDTHLNIGRSYKHVVAQVLRK